MANRTILQTIRAACNELGLPVPPSAVGSFDPMAAQMLALIESVGLVLARDFTWQALTKENRFRTVSQVQTGTTTSGSPNVLLTSTAGLSTDYELQGVGIQPFTRILTVLSPTIIIMDRAAVASATAPVTLAQTRYPLPIDFCYEIPQTEWDRTDHWPLIGPKGNREWMWLKGGIISTGPRLRWRISGDRFDITPLPAGGLEMAFEYVSSNWVGAGAGVYKPLVTLDTDTPVFDDMLMLYGLKWKWRQAHGFDYAQEYADFNDRLQRLQGQEKSAPVLSLSPGKATPLIGPLNIPESGYGIFP